MRLIEKGLQRAARTTVERFADDLIAEAKELLTSAAGSATALSARLAT
jgi:hypothetical protein